MKVWVWGIVGNGVLAGTVAWLPGETRTQSCMPPPCSDHCLKLSTPRPQESQGRGSS